RPAVVDILLCLLPVAAGAIAVVLGHGLLRWPKAIQYPAIAVIIVIVGVGAAALGVLLPPLFNYVLSYLCSISLLLYWSALFLLGAAWSGPKRGVSNAFLVVLMMVAGGFILVESSGRLWWRWAATDAWDNTPDANGNVRQSTGLTCLPAAAAMLLARFA